MLLPSEDNSVTIGAKFSKTKQGLFLSLLKNVLPLWAEI